MEPGAEILLLHEGHQLGHFRGPFLPQPGDGISIDNNDHAFNVSDVIHVLDSEGFVKSIEIHLFSNDFPEDQILAKPTLQADPSTPEQLLFYHNGVLLCVYSVTDTDSAKLPSVGDVVEDHVTLYMYIITDLIYEPLNSRWIITLDKWSPLAQEPYFVAWQLNIP